jgi:TonB-dependent starch-binding outer membrane protein SusC
LDASEKDQIVLSSSKNSSVSQQQPIKVSGRVNDSSGAPLPGVTVVIKGTFNGTITDVEGNYFLEDVPEDGVLVFSFVGMKTNEINVVGKSTINVTLQEESIGLDEVVAIGYGVQRKKLVTGATVQVKGENIAKMNTSNPLQAMQGQTPGVSIASTSGQPGSDMKVTIRGLGTVGNSQPPYLIDGVGGDISILNPADIESVDILKDAVSAAIYGAQAANGVVLITTKKGKEGKAKISFDAYYGIQSVAHTVKMLDAEQYKAIMDEQEVNSGNAPYDWSSLTSIYDKDGNLNNTNWIFTYGFNISLDYKGFDFSLNANGMAGNKIVQSYRAQTNIYSNYTTAILDRWHGEGTSKSMPRVTRTNYNWQFSDLFIHDADFLRISTITLGYDFAKLTNRKVIRKARLYAQVQNAFTFTKYDGMDPEIG